MHQYSRIELTNIGDQAPSITNVGSNHPIVSVKTGDHDIIVIPCNDVDSILFGTRLISLLSSTIEIMDANVAQNATNVRDQVTREDLSRILYIGLPTSKRTLMSTTQNFIRTSEHSLKEKFKTERLHLRYNQLSTVNGEFHVDSIVSQVKSIRDYAGGNVYFNRLGFYKFYPMENLNSLKGSHTLRILIH